MDEARINRHGFRVLFEKELTDHLESWRFWILFLLLIVVGAASLRGAVNSLTSAAQQASAQGAQLTDFMFLKLFTTSGSAIYSFSTFLAFLGPVIGIMLGFDAISSERAGGTLNRLAAQPICGRHAEPPCRAADLPRYDHQREVSRRERNAFPYGLFGWPFVYGGRNSDQRN